MAISKRQFFFCFWDCRLLKGLLCYCGDQSSTVCPTMAMDKNWFRSLFDNFEYIQEFGRRNNPRC